MVKKASERLEARLSLPVSFALKDLMGRWGCSKTAAVERAILEAHDSVPAREGTIKLPPMVEDQTHWEIQGVGKALPTDAPGEFKIEYDTE